MNQEELEKLSNQEINKIVAKLQSLKINSRQHDQDAVSVWGDEFKTDYFDFFAVDYCNKPADIMPIAIENTIDLVWMFCDGWKASRSNQGEAGAFSIISANNDNPYRAICIVYLLMKGEE